MASKLSYAALSALNGFPDIFLGFTPQAVEYRAFSAGLIGVQGRGSALPGAIRFYGALKNRARKG
ncbi:MAG TPA: hypothetical protein VM658_01835, partial [bacterium]|nr:hypothetical protein [bacterium]